MAIRVTTAELGLIIRTPLTDLSPHILIASLQVDAAVIAAGTAGGTVPSTAEQKEMERWLAAYYVRLSEPFPTRFAQDGKTTIGYPVVKADEYKKAAYALDPSGQLAQLEKAAIDKTPSLFVPCE